MNHRIFLSQLMLSLTLLAGCTALAPPYAEGVELFLQEDYAAASAELAPLAERGDPTAQYYTGLMRLKAVSDTPRDPEDAAALLDAAARGGNDDALSLLVVLSMNDSERRAFAMAPDAQPGSPQETIMPDGAYFTFPLNARNYAFAEAAAGGPVSLSLLIGMKQALFEIDAWPPDSQAIGVSGSVLRTIDSARAKRGDKYAAARLGNRYKEGLGVEKDLALAFKWNLKAARTSPAPRNCIYQAPVGDGAGSVYCYEAGAAAAGVPKAMLEVCRAYAEGAGVTRHPARAIRWCKRAAKHPRWRAQAEAVLAGIQS